jgi:hypothetical protein
LVVEYAWVVVVVLCQHGTLLFDVVVEDNDVDFDFDDDDDVDELVHVVLYIHSHYLNHHLMMNKFHALG